MARDFNGTADRIDWAAVANLTGSALTISAWIYSDGWAGNADYILEIHASGDTATGLSFYQAATHIIGFSRRGTTTTLYRGGYGSTDYFTGAWRHILVTHSGADNDYTTIHHYFGGTETSSVTSATNGTGIVPQTGSWSVGGRIYDNARNFDGKIAEVAVWNTVLGTAEIASLAGRYSAQSIGTSQVFFCPLDLDYVNTVSGVAGTAVGTGTATHPTLYYPATPAQANQAQVFDAAVPTFYPEGGGVVNLTAAQNNQAQVSDAASITASGPTYNIAPSQQNQAQVSDAAVFGVYTPITAAQNNQAQTSDAAVLGVYTVVAPSQQAQAQVSDIAVISAGESNVAGAQNNQAQVSDAAAVTASNPFIVDDIILEWVADLANISPAQNNQAQTSDLASLGVYTPVAPSQQNQAQVSDAVSLTAQAPTYNIAVAECNQAQVSDAVTFSSIVYPLTAAENNQAQVSDTAVLLFGEISVSAADNRQAQVSDAAILSAEAPTWNITAAENNQAQIIDPVSLTAIYILAAVENHQAQISDLAVVTVGGVFEHGERQLYEFDQRSNLTFATRANLEVND